MTTDVWSSLLSCFLQPLNYHIINQLKPKVTSDDKIYHYLPVELGLFDAYIANEFICHCLFQVAHLLSVNNDILKRHIPYHAVPA